MSAAQHISVPTTASHPPAKQTGIKTRSIDWQDDRFLQLMVKLRPHGGLLPIEEVRSIGFVKHANLFLGEALIRRDLFALTWRHRLWLPLFQFRMPGWELSTKASEIAGHLHPVLQGFDLAEWFVTSSPWLGERCPVDLLDTQTEQVRYAAQTDRFLLTG